MQPSTARANESDRVEEVTDETKSTASSSSGSIHTDDSCDRAAEEFDKKYALRGTEREFTISLELWDVFMDKMNSTNLVTEWMPHLFVRTTANEIGCGQILKTEYWDEMGILWRGAPWPATERLDSLTYETEKQGTAFECTNAEGYGKITVYSPHDDKMDGQYWTRQVLGKIENNSYELSRSNRAIPRCVRQLKVKTLEEMARFFKTDLVSALACFCRNRLSKLNLKGHVSHLFVREFGDPNESVYVAPMPRAKLEGVTLIQIDGSDYSLKTGKRVGYKRVGEVYEVVAEGWLLERIDDDALVG